MTQQNIILFDKSLKEYEICDYIHMKFKNRPNELKVKKMLSGSLWRCGGWGLIKKGYEGTFWGNGNVLYLVRGSNYIGICIWQNSLKDTQDLCILLYANFT